MRTIAHISDLHFGKFDRQVGDGLIADFQTRRPSLLVVSGDFTQRARPWQFVQSAEYLKRLPVPQLVVPGNHDVPMHIYKRFISPLRGYRRYISRDLHPLFEDDEMMVVGVNTARSLTQKSGWMDEKQLLKVRDQFCAIKNARMKVLVTHHPFIPSPRNPRGDVVRGAPRILERLEECGVDLLLAGHLHMAYHDDVRSHHQSARRSVLSVQAGTATSTRRRHEPNAYNWITLSPDLVTVAVRVWTGNAFEESLVTRYRRTDHVWARESQVPVDHIAAEALHAAEGVLERTLPDKALEITTDVQTKHK